MARTPQPRRIWVTRWVMKDGTVVKPKTPGAKKERTKTKTYYAYVRGKRVALGTEDLGEAWERLRRLLRGDDGVADAYRRAPLPELLEEWLRVRRAQGCGDDHAGLMRTRLTHLFGMAGWRTAADINDDGLATALAALQPGRSAETRNHFRAHALGFCRWLSRRLGSPVLRDSHPRVPVEADRRHPRRCPTDDEVWKLFEYLDAAPPGRRNRMTAAQRGLAYRVGMATGFRAEELRSLSWESFDLAASPATVTVEAGYSKHRRRDTQPLPPWLVPILRSHREAGGQLWGAFADKALGRNLKADLKASGVPHRTAGGFFDMHSLRVYYCTALAHQPGISPKTLMALCRHSSPHLTLAVYAKARQQDKADAVNQLPPPGV